MTDVVLRSQKSRLVAIFFILTMAIFVAELNNKILTVKVMASIVILTCIVGAIRSARSGFLSIQGSNLIVRTFFRTTLIPLDSIRIVEVRSVFQITPRVMPVIILKSGKTYQLSEFFMQKRSYEKTADENKITRVVNLVSTAKSSES